MPDTQRLPLPPEFKAKAIACMRKEFTDFFNTMLTPNEQWPAVPHDDFIASLAGALVDVGQQNKLGKALLQTFIHELQDHCNNA